MKYLMLLVSAMALAESVPQEPVSISKPVNVVKYDPKTDKLILEEKATWEDAAYAVLNLVKQCEQKVVALSPKPPVKKVEVKK